MAVAMTVLLACLIFVNGFFHDYFNKAQVEKLKEALTLAAAGIENSGVSYFDSFDSEVFRFTLISADGAVIYDSRADNSAMDNHIDREEIKEALENGRGSSARYSSTLTERTFYEAVKLSDGRVLRVSTTQVTIATLIMGMLPAICAIIILSGVIAVILSQRIAKSIVRPLESLDLEEPEKNDTYEELAPVLSMLGKQRRQIERQMRELKRSSDEFKQITASLNEGMLLLDREGAVISINPAAERLFNTAGDPIGQSFLTVDRSLGMSKAVETALGGEHCEFTEERCGREYRFMLTPTLSDGKILGAVILCIDVTEAVFAERNRREFTANVSHELKTPLQSIIGSAELLENGLVKPEDTARFIGNIRSEASRLVTLINDIIRLSQLDENAELPTETVDLYEELCQVASALSSTAEKKGVTLSVKGESCSIEGVRSYIYETVYNLCDNAIRYNREGGSVSLSVEKENGRAVLTVSDTGIGIPPEHQGRIFERFYRVDKSHSKETGGTGLGLSIVKHAVACLGGAVSLDSTVGVGTTVIVTL